SFLPHKGLPLSRVEYGYAADHGWLLCFRGGSAIGLSAADVWSELLPVMITPYAFSTRMSLQSSVRNYFRRNWTNCRMLSKANAQGSVPCVRNTITKNSSPDNEQRRD